MTDPRPAPYPADTRAKGWRFELNMEQVKKSDTWLRARTGRVRASLLLLWAEAWEQTPCGSLPDDDELLCLLLDMEPDEFATMRAVLMRGWWRGDDGRLYHDTLVQRVLEMLKERQKGNEVSAWAWGQLRRQVFERDNFHCRYCGQDCGIFQYGKRHAIPYLTADHVVPKSRGGLSTIDNLVTACLACNSAKGARTPDEWRAA